MEHLITGLIYFPVLGAILISALPRNYARTVALVFTLLTALCAAMLWRSFDPTVTGLQMVARRDWIPAIGAELHVGAADVMAMSSSLSRALPSPTSRATYAHPSGLPYRIFR